MSDAFGIDVGNILAQGEQIKAARLNNRLNQQSFDDEQQIRQLREQALSGQQEAIKGMAIISPAKAQELTSYIGSLTNEQKAMFEQDLDRAGKYAAYVLQAEDPAKAYEQAREEIKASNPRLYAAMPETYNPNWVQMQLAQAVSIKDIADGILKPGGGQAQRGNPPSGYQWTAEGNLKPIPGGPADKPVGGGGLETPVANAIRSTVVQQFSGSYDPQSGEFAFGDPTQAPRALSIMAEAERLAAAGDSPAIAVQKAMQAMGGGATPSGGNALGGGQPSFGGNPNDPLGLGL